MSDARTSPSTLCGCKRMRETAERSTVCCRFTLTLKQTNKSIRMLIAHRSEMDGSFDLKSMQRSNNFVCVLVCVFRLTMACEGRVMEPLDRTARRMHRQIPTFMTASKNKMTQFADGPQQLRPSYTLYCLSDVAYSLSF